MYKKEYFENNKEKFHSWQAKYRQKESSKKNNRLRSENWRKNNPERYKELLQKTRKKYSLRNTIQRYFQYLEYGKLHKLTSSQFFHALEGWKKLVKQRDKFCFCGEKTEHAHHIFPKAKYPELALNLNNGIGLCIQHHNEPHYRKIKVT